MKGKRSYTAYGLNEANILDFKVLVLPEVVSAIQSDDGTAGFVVGDSRHFVGALCGRFVTPVRYEITSIYVSEEDRRAGAGTFMMDTLYELLEGIDAEVTVDVVRGSKGTDALSDFLTVMGFDEYFLEERATYLTSLSEVGKLKLTISKELTISSFRDMPQYVFNSFEPGDNISLSLPEGGFNDKSIDPDISMGIIKDKKLVGYALLEGHNGGLIFDNVYVAEGEPRAALMSLIASVRNAAVKKYSADTKLYIPTANEKLGSFVESVFPEESLSEGLVTYKKRLNTYDTDDYSRLSLSEFLEQEGETFDEYGSEAPGDGETAVALEPAGTPV